MSRVEGSATTHFHYDRDGTLIAESDGAGAVIREYLWLGPKPVGLVVGPATSPTLYFVHADHLDRVQKITDAAQAIVWDGQFTPYGRTHAIAGTVTNPLRFPGQWADPAAGYFYNYMRDYDPTLARYLSVDPLGTGGGRNKFGYAEANPQNLVDPTGSSSWYSQAALFGAITLAIDAVSHSAFGDRCKPYTFGQALGAFAEGAFLGVGFRALGLGLRALGGAGAGVAGAGAVAGTGAGAASGQGAGVLSRFLASESGALHLNNLGYQGTTIVYRIFNATSGQTFKYGMTSILPIMGGSVPPRVAMQLSRLGSTFHAETISVMSTRAQARALEKLLNIGYYSGVGRLPPGSRRF